MDHNPLTKGNPMSPKATNRTVVAGTNPNPNAPETLRPSQLTIVPEVTPSDETVTPETVLARIESELVKAGGMWAKGAKAFALKTAGQRIHNALAEVQAAEAHARQLREGMAQLIAEGIAAINGQTPPSKKATPKASTTTPTTGGVTR